MSECALGVLESNRRQALLRLSAGELKIFLAKPLHSTQQWSVEKLLV